MKAAFWIMKKCHSCETRSHTCGCSETETKLIFPLLSEQSGASSIWYSHAEIIFCGTMFKVMRIRHPMYENGSTRNHRTNVSNPLPLFGNFLGQFAQVRCKHGKEIMLARYIWQAYCSFYYIPKIYVIQCLSKSRNITVIKLLIFTHSIHKHAHMRTFKKQLCSV